MDEQVKAIFERLGVNPEDRDKTLIKKNMTGKITEKGRKLLVKYQVEIDVNLVFEASLTELKNSVRLTIAEAKPKVAFAEAKKEISGFSGDTHYRFLPVEERVVLYRNDPQWQGVKSAIQPVVHFSSTLGNSRTVIQFEDPFPVSISPLSNLEDLQSEIGDKREWSGLKAKVVETENPDLSVGSTYTGSVTIKKIPSHFELPELRGGPRVINSDIAFEIYTNFQSEDTTRALGMYPLMRYYFDCGAKDFKAIISDSDTRTDEMTYFLK